jgi:hypothetical protein
MPKFYIEKNNDGIISGWALPKKNAEPVEVVVSNGSDESNPIVFSTDARRDVFLIYQSIFCGFHVEISSDNNNPIVATINSENIIVNPMKTQKIRVIIDIVDRISISGWIDSEEPPFSLLVSDGVTIEYAALSLRDGISSLRGNEFAQCGFTLKKIQASQMKWILLNNRYIHFF